MFKHTITLFLLALQMHLMAQQAPAPLFRDPITDGAADPALIYNKAEKSWWMLYTQRRANVESADVAYCYGNKIAVASSDDHGQTWVYRGTLDLDFEQGENTFWAPDIFYANGKYHMYLSYIRGIRNHWGGNPVMQHYSSPDLWNWTHHGPLDLGANDVIDPTLFLKDHIWHMWYKDNTAKNGNISVAISKDLQSWTVQDRGVIDGHGQEGAKVFSFKGQYWMLTDEWTGMRIYHSTDLQKWTKQGKILADKGSRPDDSPQGAHGDVVVVNDKAYVIYFTHPGRDSHGEAPLDKNGNIPYAYRRSSIQAAELILEDGTLKAIRNEPFTFHLPTLN